MQLTDALQWTNRLSTFGDLSGREIVIWGPGVGVGDWANATIGFRELHKAYPGIRIGVITGIDPSYMQLCPYVFRSMQVECLSSEDLSFIERATAGINFQRDDATLWQRPDGTYTGTLERHFAQFGLPIPTDHSPCFSLPSPLLCRARNALAQQGFEQGRTIVHHCGAKNPALRWPQEQLLDFARRVDRWGYQVAVIGLPEEWQGPADAPGLHSFVGQHDLPMTIALMTMAGYYVGGHSGPNCIGGGLPIKMISLYAYEEHHRRWSAEYSNSYDVMLDTPCEGNHLQQYDASSVTELFDQLVSGELSTPHKHVIHRSS